MRRSGDDCSDLMRRGFCEAAVGGAEVEVVTFVQPLTCSPKAWPVCPTGGMV